MSDFEDSHTVKQNKQLDMEQKRLSKVIERENSDLSELRKHYESSADKVRILSEKLRIKEEQRVGFVRILDKKDEEIIELKSVFRGMIKEKEEEIEQLEKELSMKKEELLEHSVRLQDLQKELDKKTADYEQISGELAQLDICNSYTMAVSVYPINHELAMV